MHFLSVRVLLVAAALSFTSHWVNAQEYKLYSYHIENGLPTDVIKDVAQDSLGFIWIATDDGLVKFDGNRFTLYKNALHSQYAKRFVQSRKGHLYLIGDLDLIEIINKLDTVIFRNVRTATRNPTDSTLWYPKSFYEDHSGALWVGEPQSVALVKGASFRRFPFEKADQTATFTRSFSFFEDEIGSIFTVSYPGRVFQLDAAQNKFKFIAQFPKNVNDTKIIDHELWVAANDGLYKAQLLKTGGFSELEKVNAMQNASFIKQLPNKKILITSFSKDHYLYDPSTKKAEAFPFKFNDVNSITITRDDDLFISSSEGLILLQENIFQTVRSPAFEPTFIQSMAENPANGTLYFTTVEKIYKINFDKDSAAHVQQIDFIPSLYYQSLVFDHGKLWASNRSQILLYENDRLKKTWNFESDGLIIFDIAKDHEGNIWGSQDGNRNAICITPDLNVRKISVPLSPQAGLNALRETSKGIYGVSSGLNSYLYFKAPHDSSFKNVSIAPPFKPESDLSIVDLVELGGTLWLASSEGLLRYDSKSLQRVDLGDYYTRLAVKAVRQLNADEILFANSFGLFRYNIKTNDWWIYDDGNGLPTNTVYARGILVGTNNRVWVGTSKGIAYSKRSIILKKKTPEPWIGQVVVNGEKVRFVDALKIGYGSFIDIEMATNSFPSGAVTLQYKFNDDKDWRNLRNTQINFNDLPSGNNQVQFRAKKNGGYDWSAARIFHFSTNKPFWQEYWFFLLVSIVLFSVAYTSFILARRQAKKRRRTLEELLDEITVKNQQLELQSEEINHSHSALQQLYKEVNNQREELQAQAEELTEANNALGQLTRDLQEKNEEVRAQAEELTESNETIRQLNEGLEIKVMEKSKDLLHTNEELSKYNSDLAQFSYSISHNLRGPVARLLGLTTILPTEVVPSEREKILNMIKRSSTELDEVLRDLTNILELRKNLSQIIDKILFEEEWARCTSMLKDQLQDDFDIRTDFSKAPYVFGVRGLVQSILFNLFSNAIKYRSPERKLVIEVRTGRNNNETFFEIKDNGLGFDVTSQQDKVFKLYKRFHTHVQGRGVGLYLVKTQVEILNGKVEVSSQLGAGTTFYITFPDREKT